LVPVASVEKLISPVFKAAEEAVKPEAILTVPASLPSLAV